jgi:hypothetical protein
MESLAIRRGGFRQAQPAERWRHWQASSRCRECVIVRWKLRYLPLKGRRSTAFVSLAKRMLSVGGRARPALYEISDPPGSPRLGWGSPTSPFQVPFRGRYYRRYQIRTFWAFMPQGRLLPLSWMVDPCLRSARPFGLVGPLRATSALPVTRMASGLPSTSP